jgi:hypothetical protein
MARVSPIVTAFNNGEISPYMYGRIDNQKYPLSLRECLNFVPLVQGPLVKRDGTRFVVSTADETKKSRLLGFEFNPTQGYVVEINDDRARFITLRGLLTQPKKSVSAVSTANPTVITSNGHGYSDGDQVVFPSVGPFTALANKVFTVDGATANTFELLGQDGSGFPGFSGTVEVAKVHHIDSPYSELELPGLYPLQSADVLYLFHKDHRPQKLIREGLLSWGFQNLTFTDGPYMTQNATATTLTPSGTSGSVTITASAVTGINGDQGFQTTDVGRLIRFQGSTGNWTWMEITARSSTTVVTATIKGSALPNTNARSTWRLGLYSDTTGWPSCGGFFKERLILSGPPSAPYFVIASRSGLYEEFTPSEQDGTIAADHGFAYALVERQVSAIRWFGSNDRGLIAGTSAGEALIRQVANNEPFSALNIEVVWPTTYGSADVSPVQTDTAILFCQRGGKRLRELAYVFEIDGFRAPNMSVMADHLMASGLDRLALQSSPLSIIWAKRKDNKLIGFSYDREQNVTAWHQHTLGGTDVQIEDIISISAPDGGSDDFWVLVSRTVNGVTRRYIEFIGDLFTHDTPQEDAVFVDAAVVYKGSPVSTISGFHHLEGETVRILADGVQVDDEVVTNGAITIAEAASTWVVGLPYKARMHTLRPEAGSQDGTAQGKLKRIFKFMFRLYRTLGGKAGADEEPDDLNEIDFRTNEYSVTEPLLLFSGDVGPFDFPGGYEHDGGTVYENDTAYPCTITAYMPRMVTEDGG